MYGQSPSYYINSNAGQFWPKPWELTANAARKEDDGEEIQEETEECES